MKKLETYRNSQKTSPSPRSKPAATRPPGKAAIPEIPWSKLLHEARHRFGIQRFRPGQREVLESVFRGRDTLALMPTGSGKSLTYQLPALFLSKPVVVVSPLIALMQDQKERAGSADLVAENMNSSLTHVQAEAAHEEIAEHKAQLIYVTPERLETPEFIEELKASGGISLLVVDEAHTIAQWGHDFRPAFLSIGEARRKFGNPPVLALTATATDEVVDEILHVLHAKHATRINTGTERANLHFAVHPTVNNEAKLARIVKMLSEAEGTGIIYTASVRSANELYDFLTEHGISAAHYHGRMGTRERERVQSEFMRGEHKVMIATKAFGLGIDKPDIRFVYHFEFPDSLETYYQEAGRAGRDGLPAHCVLLYRLEDKRIQTYFLGGRYPKPAELEAVYHALAGRVLTETSTEARATPAELTQSLADAVTEPAQVTEASAPATHTHAQKPVVTALTVADESKVGRRRTQVILHLLREAGVIHRTPRGYMLNSHNPPTAEQVEELLQTYVDRGQRDKDRLAEMMHFAETSSCRVQVIRAYFGEDGGEPCTRCDNCERGQAEHRPVAAAEEPKAALDGNPAPPSTEHHEAVTTVQTTFGEIHTTAPETLPAPAEPAPFAPGAEVMHKHFGPGRVLDVHDQMVLVAFSKQGQKRLRADFLQSA